MGKKRTKQNKKNEKGSARWQMATVWEPSGFTCVLSPTDTSWLKATCHLLPTAFSVVFGAFQGPFLLKIPVPWRDMLIVNTTPQTLLFRTLNLAFTVLGSFLLTLASYFPRIQIFKV